MPALAFGFIGGGTRIRTRYKIITTCNNDIIFGKKSTAQPLHNQKENWENNLGLPPFRFLSSWDHFFKLYFSLTASNNKVSTTRPLICSVTCPKFWNQTPEPIRRPRSRNFICWDGMEWPWTINRCT
jgi:hypothetical protein